MAILSPVSGGGSSTSSAMAPNLWNTPGKIHEVVAKVFAGIAATALALTFYTVFWFTAAPATVIAAFHASLITTILSTLITAVAIFSRPDIQKEITQEEAPVTPPHVNLYQPAPAYSGPVTLPTPPAPRAPSLEELRQQEAALVLSAARAEATRQAEAARRAAEQERASQEAAQRYAIEQEAAQFQRRCDGIRQDFQRNLQAAESVRAAKLSHLSIQAGLLESLDAITQDLAQIQWQLRSLGSVVSVNEQELANLKGSVQSLEQEIVRKQAEAAQAISASRQELTRLQEWQQNRGDQGAIELEIAQANVERQEALKPVKGLGAAKAAVARQKECEKRIGELQGRLARMQKVAGYEIDPVQGERRLAELSRITQGTEEERLGIPALRQRLSIEKQRLRSIEDARSTYHKFERLNREKERLERAYSFKMREMVYRDVETLRREYTRAVTQINHEFELAKAPLEAQRDAALRAEEQNRYRRF